MVKIEEQGRQKREKRDDTIGQKWRGGDGASQREVK